MKINNLLESVSAIVYHFTTFPAAVEILKTDTLKSSSKRSNRISLSRSITGQFAPSNRLIGVIFELDGRKLSYTYKGGPVGGGWTADDKNGKSTQYEDLINANEIKNISSYITDAFIYLPVKFFRNFDDEFMRDYLPQLEKLPTVVNQLSSAGLPLKFILNKNDLYNKRYSNLEDAKQAIKKNMTTIGMGGIPPELESFLNS